MTNDMEQLNLFKNCLIEDYQDLLTKLEKYPSHEEDAKLIKALLLSELIHRIWEWNT